MTLSSLVSDPMFFEVPYNVTTYTNNESKFIFSNFITDTLPPELENKTIKHITMHDGYLEIEV